MRLSIQLDVMALTDTTRYVDDPTARRCAPRNHSEQLMVRPGHAWSSRHASAMSWMEPIRNGTSGGFVHPWFLRRARIVCGAQDDAKCCETSPSICPSARKPPVNFGEFHFGLELASPRRCISSCGRFRELGLDEVEWTDEPDNISMKVRDPDRLGRQCFSFDDRCTPSLLGHDAPRLSGMTGELAKLRRAFSPSDLQPHLVETGVVGTILVETRSDLKKRASSWRLRMRMSLSVGLSVGSI